jgi:hypothetical protein
MHVPTDSKVPAAESEPFVPAKIGAIENHQTALPRIARDPKLTGLIDLG